MLIIATTPMSRCSSTALQNCRSAAQQPRLKTCMPSAALLLSARWQQPCLHCNYNYELLQFYNPAEVQHSNHAHKPVHPFAALLLSVARWQQPCLSLQLHLGDFAVHTALQNCRSAAQQPCPQTCACPLQHCCCQWQGGNSLAHHCNYTYELLQFYSPAELQKCSTATMLTNLCMPFAALLLSVARWQQPCSSLQLHLHAHKPEPSCCSQWQGGNSLASATTIMCCCSSYSPAELQKCSTATMPTNLCMPSAALLLSVARWQQPCSSLQLQL